jgi:hypothetical protein
MFVLVVAVKEVNAKPRASKSIEFHTESSCHAGFVFWRY